MYPELFHFGPVTVYTYGALFALAIVVAAFFAMRRARLINLDSLNAFDLVVWTALAGIVGGRLAYIFENFSFYKLNPFDVFKLWEGGLVFHGGVLASLVYVFIFSRRRKISFLAVLDFLLPYVALAYGIGRVGCYLNGCCYGIPFDGAWAIKHPFLDYTVHPTQLYSALAGFLLFWFLIWVDNRKTFFGQTTASYFLIYSASRILIEFYRGDKAHDVFGFATSAQVVFAGIFVVSILMYISFRMKSGK